MKTFAAARKPTASRGNGENNGNPSGCPRQFVGQDDVSAYQALFTTSLCYDCRLKTAEFAEVQDYSVRHFRFCNPSAKSWHLGGTFDFGTLGAAPPLC